MATYSNILPWRIQWTEEPVHRLQSMGSQELDMTEQLYFHFSLLYGHSVNKPIARILTHLIDVYFFLNEDRLKIESLSFSYFFSPLSL